MTEIHRNSRLSERSTVTGTVLSGDTDLLCSLGLGVSSVVGRILIEGRSDVKGLSLRFGSMPVHVVPFPHVRVSRMLPIVLPQRLFMTNVPHAELSRRFELSHKPPRSTLLHANSPPPRVVVYAVQSTSL